VGIPKTVDPLPPTSTPEDVLPSLDAADLHHIRTPSQVHLAYACGYSRPECTGNEFRPKVARAEGLWVQGSLHPWTRARSR